MSGRKNILKRMMHLSLLASVGFAALLSLAQTDAALAATAPTPGAWQSFGVLAGSTVTNTGPTIITGDLGVSPGTAITGFPPGIVSPPGTIYSGPGPAATAQTDLTTAYNDLSQPCDASLTGSDLGSVGTLTAKVYCFSTSAQLTNTLTLSGNASDVWIFRIGSTLTTASNSSVLLTGTAQACNVFWQVGTSATLGTDTAFQGNILALASITMNTGATLAGRALARNGAVTLDTNTTDATVCAGVPVPPPNVGLFKVFSPATINVGGPSTLTITLTNVAGTSTPANITSFIDAFPPGMVIANPTNAGTTCAGSTVGAVIGDNKVTLTGGQIPGGDTTTPGFCTVTVDVSAPAAGSFLNGLGAGTLVTDQGSNEAGPSVLLNAVVPPVTGLPTLSEWGMIIFMVLGGFMSIYYLRRQKAKA